MMYRYGDAEKAPGEPTRLAPEALLAERFASGEIEETEYLQRRAVLQSMPGKPVGANHASPASKGSMS